MARAGWLDLSRSDAMTAGGMGDGMGGGMREGVAPSEQFTHPGGGVFLAALQSPVGEGPSVALALDPPLLPETNQDGHHRRIGERPLGRENLVHFAGLG